jgi:hypothetical protein
MTERGTDWAAWLASRDRQQEHPLPDREEPFAVMFDVVEAVAGTPRRVLDLACAPGSITVRLLDRFPGAAAVLVDVDPGRTGAGRTGGEHLGIVLSPDRGNNQQPGTARVPAQVVHELEGGPARVLQIIHHEQHRVMYCRRTQERQHAMKRPPALHVDSHLLGRHRPQNRRGLRNQDSEGRRVLRPRRTARRPVRR